MTEAARRVMRKLMTTEVALKMNWMGKRGKIGLSTMDLKNVIFGESPFSQVVAEEEILL